MSTLAPFTQEIFRTHGPRYLERFGASMPQAHKQVIAAIMDCRSQTNGAVLYQCEGCGEQQLVPRCCGNRHCPVCQQGKAYAWLERQLERQLPTPYFMLSFTVPEQLRPFLRRHQRLGYAALFEASAGSIKKLAPDPKYIGADTPASWVSCTPGGARYSITRISTMWCRAGRANRDTRRWQGCSASFLLPVQALSSIVRAKFRDAMGQAGCWGRSLPRCGRSTGM